MAERRAEASAPQPRNAARRKTGGVHIGMSRGAYYPLFADLRGRRCVVVGGGLIAQRKVTTLLGCGATVVVVSPTLTRRLHAAQRAGAIEARRRSFRPTDVRGAWLVCAATDDQRINESVFQVAQRRRIFANVVDQKPLCSFIAPSIVRRGDLVIAISTGGASPAMAKHLRRRLTAMIGSEYVQMVNLLRSLRGIAKQKLPGYAARKKYFDALVEGPAFRLVRSGRVREARRKAMELLERSATSNGHP